MRVLLRRPRHKTVTVGAAVATVGGIRARGIVGVDPNATIEEKVAFLLRRETTTQERIDDLREGIDDLRTATDRRFDETRAETEEWVLTEIRRALDTHRRLRLVGIALLVVGAALLNLGNFA